MLFGFVEDADGTVLEDGQVGVGGGTGVDDFSFAPGFSFVIADAQRQILAMEGVGVAEQQAVLFVAVFDGGVAQDGAVAARRRQSLAADRLNR